MRRTILLCLFFLLTACATNEPSPESSPPLSTASVEQVAENLASEESAATLATKTKTVPSQPTDIPLSLTETVPSPTETAQATQTVPPSPTETAQATQTVPPSPTETAQATETAAPSPTETAQATESAAPLPTETAQATQSAAPSPTETAQATQSAAPSLTETAPQTAAPPLPTETAQAPATEPPLTGTACLRPPDDYRRIEIWVPQLSRQPVISQRTLAMLQNAQALYGGIGSMQLIIQGSYAAGLGASFGTHDGGGAVDIWPVEPNNTANLLDDIENMVRSLREAGFAAWYRPKDMLYVGMYPHIHAIAIGDAELSDAAVAQLTGDEAYFRGRNGLPQPEFMGWDPHGGPIHCAWMEEMGYKLLPYPAESATEGEEEEGASNNDSSETSESENEVSENEQTDINTTSAMSCQQPTDDYRRIIINGHTLNQRTYSMLQTAQALYGGPGDLLQITQGSYNAGLAASFGTHDGGGAVDLSIRHPQTGEYLYEETERMVQALRQAGFAAWYRTPEQNFSPHIHAIAIGDNELSDAAAAQLTGEQGYFRGRNGLPDERAGPDPHGGAWICDWMIRQGYQDLR